MKAVYSLVAVILLSLVVANSALNPFPFGTQGYFDFSSDGDNALDLSAPPQESQVTTNSGPIEGLVYEKARVFHAIPYAAPPVGNFRFASPQPAIPWNETLMTKVYGPGCPQVCELPPLTCPLAGVNESCLTLDVYTPRASALNIPRAVLVFFYGGNFRQGGTSTPLYNGIQLANTTEVIVVTVNYRLGALGFFTNNNGVQGNFAIQDQTFGLQWVQKNIASFGGNPNNVTIFGQSAGGTSVAAHMVSPPAKGLFSSAIMESNPLALYLKTPETARRLSSRFAEFLNCTANDLKCLRSVDVPSILQAQIDAIKVDPLSVLQAFMPWQPYVDGQIITAQPMDAFVKTGQYNAVPMMLGSVNDEGVMFIDAAFPEPVGYVEYKAFILLIFGPGNAKQIEQMYPVAPSQYNDTRPVLSTMGTDYIFACPNRNITRSMTNRIATTNAPVYLYHFDHILSFNPWGPNYTECTTNVCHGSELPFVFGSAPYGGYQWGPGEAELSAQMEYNWGNFATSGNPNAPFPPTVTWPQYNTAADQDILFATPSSVESNYRKQYCDFWDTIGYHWGN